MFIAVEESILDFFKRRIPSSGANTVEEFCGKIGRAKSTVYSAISHRSLDTSPRQVVITRQVIAEALGYDDWAQFVADWRGENEAREAEDVERQAKRIANQKSVESQAKTKRVSPGDAIDSIRPEGAVIDLPEILALIDATSIDQAEAAWKTIRANMKKRAGEGGEGKK